MRLPWSTILLALPALVSAEEQQKPLADKVKGWLNKAQNYVQSSVAPSIPNPLDAGASKVAQHVVHPLTLDNWKDSLAPSAPSEKAKGKKQEPEEWLVFLTGANKTCYGMCEKIEREWNQSIALISATPNPPKLGLIDCDAEPVLCNSWASGPPSLWHFIVPSPLPDQSTPSTTVRYIKINRANTTAADIAAVHTKKLYEETPVYESFFWHPFDGLFAKLGLAVPVGYAAWGLSKMPSWLPMVAISFLTRSFMGRRAWNRGQQGQEGQAAPAAGRPAAQ